MLSGATVATAPFDVLRGCSGQRRPVAPAPRCAELPSLPVCLCGRAPTRGGGFSPNRTCGPSDLSLRRDRREGSLFKSVSQQLASGADYQGHTTVTRPGCGRGLSSACLSRSRRGCTVHCRKPTAMLCPRVSSLRRLLGRGQQLRHGWLSTGSTAAGEHHIHKPLARRPPGARVGECMTIIVMMTRGAAVPPFGPG